MAGASKRGVHRIQPKPGVRGETHLHDGSRCAGKHDLYVPAQGRPSVPGRGGGKRFGKSNTLSGVMAAGAGGQAPFTLRVTAPVKMGETVFVTGEAEALGEWDLTRAVQLVTTPER